MRIFLGNVRKGKPFAPENPLMLRKVGWIVTIEGPLFTVFQHFYARIYMHLVDISGATYDVARGGFTILIIPGLIIVVIAQVYDEAVQMRALAELTV